MLNCLIAEKTHISLEQALSAAGITVFDITTHKYEENPYDIADIIVIRSKTAVDAQLLARMPRLKIVARAGAGIDKIDVPALQQRGITLLTVPEGNRDAVAEHAMGMLLALLNHIPSAQQEIKQGLWNREPNRGTEIAGKTVAIIGYGNMGSALAERLSAFQCRVLAFDTDPNKYNHLVQGASLDVIQKEADIVSLNVPLTEENRYAFSYDFLSAFAKPIWLVNTARGELLRLTDVERLLTEGKLLGACLDVLEYEDMNTMPEDFKAGIQRLLATGKVLITPHVAGWTFESYEKISRFLADKILMAAKKI